MLTADELLAGSAVTHELTLPDSLLPAGGSASGPGGGKVRIRPLTVADLQLISRAARESDSLLATLMVQRALVEPELSVAQVASLRAGLVEFLLREVNRVSGIGVTGEQVAAAVADPLTQAAFILAQEFGWTPQQIGELTLGQILVHLQLLRERGGK